MAFTAQIQLINAALALRTRLATDIDVTSSSPENLASSNRRAIAHVTDNGTERFYISTNKSGTWEWVEIGTGGTAGDGSYVIVADETERDLLTPEEGMVAFVLTTRSEHRYLDGEWVVDVLVTTIPEDDGSDPGQEVVIVGDITKHKAVFIEYVISNDTGTEVLIETGSIKLTNQNDNKVSNVASFDDVEVTFEKEIDNDDIKLIMYNNLQSEATFDAKLTWYYI